MNEDTTHPVSLRSVLPVETLDLIFECLSRDELLGALRTNSLFHRVGARVLYRSLVDLQPVQAVRLARTIAHNNLYASYVRIVGFDWGRCIVTANFLRLLNRALRQLRFILKLSLEFSTTDSTSHTASVLNGCTFSLKSFSTSIRCSSTLVRFLETQNNITDLCLRGINAIDAAPLSPAALPHLSHFRTVLSWPTLTANFICNRPVESVSMSVYPHEMCSALNVLLLSSKPIRRLTIMSFDTAEPVSLLREIAFRLPGLEALHLVVLPTHLYTHDMLLGMGSSLSPFKCLKYLTFMAPGTGASVDDEGMVAMTWHEACPTLKTIILPRGMVWALTNGKWLCWDDDPSVPPYQDVTNELCS
ncbi:hypothetical protein BKA82DRAFT_152200 [Pisolithus tinctorius]|nr:hypothetical protein BKA82DRAFT_152200 [Pisolithus tinctorius]